MTIPLQRSPERSLLRGHFDVLPYTFGYGAFSKVVEADNEQAPPSDAAEEIEGIRGSFASLSPDQQASIEPYLLARARDILSSRHGSLSVPKSPAMTWAEWLGSRASLEDISAFLESHIRELDRVNRDPSVNQKLEAQKEEYIDFLANAARRGGLSEQALHASSLLRRIRALHGDIWDTTLQGVYGYHQYGRSYVVLEQPWKGAESTKNMDWLMPHELGHAFSGGWLPSWAEEAICHYVALQKYHDNPMKRGQMENFRPQPERSFADKDVYLNERWLMHVALKGRDPALLTRMWSSGGIDSQESHEARFELEGAWGVPYVWEAICARVAHHKETLLKAHSGKPLHPVYLNSRSSRLTADELVNNPSVVFPDPRETATRFIGVTTVSVGR